MPINTASNWLEKLVDADVRAHIGIEPEFNPHTLEDFPAADHYLFFQLEFRYAEGEQAADLRVAVKHHRPDAVARQDIGTAQARGARADDRHALAGGHHAGHVRSPAHGKGGIGNILLRGADGDGAKAVIQGAGTLAQPVLGTHPAADLRQGVGLVTELRGLEQVALGNQFQPVGNEIVDRALPLTVGVAALQAAMGLVRHLLLGIGIVDLHILGFTRAQALLVGVVATDIDKLEVVFQTLAHSLSLLLPA